MGALHRAGGRMAQGQGDRAGPDAVHDLLVIGGGINGCGIARDAAGRGLSVGSSSTGGGMRSRSRQ